MLANGRCCGAECQITSNQVPEPGLAADLNVGGCSLFWFYEPHHNTVGIPANSGVGHVKQVIVIGIA